MKGKYSIQAQSILRRLFTVFIIIFLLFTIMLVPLFLYLQNVFTELQIEKSRQQLNTGVAKMQEIVIGMMNISDALLDDTRFVSLSYTNTDYSQVNVTTRNQLKNTFNSLLTPYDEVIHAALQINQNVVLTNHTVFFEDINIYYPDFFCVNDLSFEEWTLLLEENKNSFIAASKIKTYSDEYEALIYPIRWKDTAYLYACIDVEDIKSMMIAESDKDHYRYSIMTLDGTLLYSDLPKEESNYLNPAGYTSITEKSSIGSMQISLHMDNSIFYSKMQPLYYFMAIYGSLCIVMFFFTLFMGIKLSSRPILNVDRLMNRYQSTITAQNSILQARFLERAMNGHLASPRDIEQFHMYFPDFPVDGYCLLLLRLISDHDVSESIYKDPLYLLQTYLEEELPGVYLQRMNDSELLFLIAQKDYPKYAKIFDFVIENVSKEEPLYHVNCVVSKFHNHVESLPAAYRQIQNMANIFFPCKRNHVCTVNDCKDIAMHSVSLAKLIPMYSAITSGNQDMALEQLRSYSEEVLQTQNTSYKKQVYEIIRAILLCIKQEYPTLLIDENIPAYHISSGSTNSDTPCDYGDIYLWFEETIKHFCSLIGTRINETESSLVKRLVQYIDANYTDCDLCLMSLETHFNCSSSTMRSLFKEEMNITITSYIEQQRMKRANELLLQNQKPVKDIALECGFSNANSFYKAYKRVYGCSPTKTMKSTD